MVSSLAEQIDKSQIIDDIYDSEVELAPFSPASSVSVMSVGSDSSPSPDPDSNNHR